MRAPSLPLRRRAATKRRTRRDRGAALLVAISSVAILTAVAVDLAYNTRVSLQAAANSRDELRAFYLAKSAVAMSRLVLRFQQQLDGAATGAAGLAGLLTGATTAAGAQAGTSQQATAALGGLGSSLGALGSMMSGGIRLWDLVPIDSSVAALFLGGAGSGARRPSDARGPATPPATTVAFGPGAAASGARTTPAPIARATPGPARPGTPAAGPPGTAPPGGVAPPPQLGTRRAFGDFDGSFHATIDDEDRKINVRQFDGINPFPVAQTVRLAQLFRERKWDFLFDEDDANGWRVSRRDLFGFIKDWEDDDEMSSTYTGDPLKPFQPGYGDENYLYDRLQDRYRAKNAPFDSQDELFMVAGISDAFVAAFGDRLTVYPDVSGTINVNTDDPEQLIINALLMSDPQGVPQPALADPAFIQKLRAALALVRPLPFMSITPQQFATVLQTLGVKVQAPYTQSVNTDSRGAFGNTSKTFRIRAVGVAGDVRKQLEVIVTFDTRRAGVLAQDQGRVLHWRED